MMVYIQAYVEWWMFAGRNRESEAEYKANGE